MAAGAMHVAGGTAQVTLGVGEGGVATPEPPGESSSGNMGMLRREGEEQ